MCVHGHTPHRCVCMDTHRTDVQINTALCSGPASAPGTTNVPVGHNNLSEPHTPVWKEQVGQLFHLGKKASWISGTGEDQVQKSRKTFTMGHPYVGAENGRPFTQGPPMVG